MSDATAARAKCAGGGVAASAEEVLQKVATIADVTMVPNARVQRHC